MIVVNSVPAPYRRSAVAQNVPTKSKPGTEVFPGSVVAARRNSRIAGVENSRRSVRIARGLRARAVGGEFIVEIGIREERIPAHAQIHCQPPRDANGVL